MMQAPQRPQRPQFDHGVYDGRDDWRGQMGDWRNEMRDWRGDMRDFRQDWRQQFQQPSPQASSYQLGDLMQRFPEQGMPNMRIPLGWNGQPGL
jgi:hypothetical protein